MGTLADGVDQRAEGWRAAETLVTIVRVKDACRGAVYIGSDR